MPVARPFNFQKWIDEHRHLLKPPVGNQQVFKDNQDFIVMVVGGPNARKDYHVDEGEELFLQIEGDIVVKIIEDGKPVDIEIKAGEMFLSWTASSGTARIAAISCTRNSRKSRTS
jgi:3-hydroxyanthranilate 3,4-dioxygenase